MESVNYIDRLSVDLKLQSTYKPYEAQEAADSIVDKHVLPAVESVLEDMGRNTDASIPKIEIDLGRVRLQDLRDVLESRLRSALEVKLSSASVTPVDALREFAGTGKAPWETGDRPFSPPQFLQEVLEGDAGTAMDLIAGFSETELAGLLMAVPPSFARKGEGKGKEILESILDRLMQVSPETAAVVTARQSFWRDYLRLSEAAAPAVVTEASLPVPDEVGFRYVEIGLQDIPEGVSVDVAEYIDTPGPNAPEFIMEPGTPVRYYRKVVAAGAEIIPPAALPDVPHSDVPGPYSDAAGSSAAVPVYRYVEIALKDIPEGAPGESMDLPDVPGPDTPEFILEFGPPVKYYRKVAVAGAGVFPPAAEVGPARWDVSRQAPAASRSAGAPAAAEIPEYQVEKEIPAKDSGSVPAGRDAEMPHVRQDVPQEREDALPERAEILQKRAEALQQRAAEARQGRTGDQQPQTEVLQGKPAAEPESETVPQPLGEASADKVATGETSADTGEKSIDNQDLPRADYPVFRYVEIDRREIPEAAPVEVSDYIEAPGPDAPEYIMTVGYPIRFYKKTETPGPVGLQREEESSAGTLPAGALPARDIPAGETAVAEAPSRSEPPSPVPEPETDIWEVRDFESVLTRERIPVSDAGLVLLHPFLHLLMRNLGLTKGGKFVSALARVRAVHLLRDLTGSPEPHYSQNLILEKILCGLPPGYALPPEWEPDENEKEETEALLKAVCGHWRSLSGSSVKALCDGFILRPGTVERFEETWIVKVEGRTIDILMEDLPWELSMILLPWRDNPISIEWQHE